MVPGLTGPAGEIIRTVFKSTFGVTLQGKFTLVLSGGRPLSVTVTMALKGILVAAPAAMVPLTKPVAALRVSPKGRPEALKVSPFPSGSLALSWSPDYVVPFDIGLRPRSV